MPQRLHISFLLALLLIPLFEVAAEVVEPEATSDNLEVFVDTVVNIDKDNRILTLRSQSGEESTFTLGLEVQNVDQIKLGEQVIVKYFNAFAIALGARNVELNGDIHHLDSKIVYQSDKPAVPSTRKISATGVVEAVDIKTRLVTVKEGDQAIIVSVAENFGLSSIIPGEEVDVIYIESYAVGVGAADTILGKVSINSTSVAIGLGFAWGEGELTMYDGSTYTFDIETFSLLDVGITLVKAEGEASRVIEPEDLEGKYWAAEIGISYGNGVSAVTMKNDKGVILHLNSKLKGMKATLAAEGLKIKNIQPVKE